MRVFVYEYVTGGGLRGEALEPQLVEEGRLMADRLVQDITAIPDTEVLIARDPRIPHDFPPGVKVLSNDPGTVWRMGLAQADSVWPIAPESGGVLARLTREAEASGRPLLTSAATAVEMAGSKRRTARCLAASGIDVVPTVDPGEAMPQHKGAWVIKPDDGVGCEGQRIFPDRQGLGRWMLSSDTRGWVVQPWLDGDSLSLSLLCLDGMATLLSINRQLIVRHGDRIAFEGCHVNIPAPSRHAEEALLRLAARVASAIPGLRGIIGVDFLWTRKGARVLEVNPRLTTSYAGLHQALDINPAHMVLDLATRGLTSVKRLGTRTFTIQLPSIQGAVNHA